MRSVLILAADCKLEEPKEALVQHEGISGECEHISENDDAVVDHRFLVRPDDLFQFKLQILEPLGDAALLFCCFFVLSSRFFSFIRILIFFNSSKAISINFNRFQN